MFLFSMFLFSISSLVPSLFLFRFCFKFIFSLVVASLFWSSEVLYAKDLKVEAGDLLNPASGGETTSHLSSIRAFNTPASNILKTTHSKGEPAHDLLFQVGNSIFASPWVAAGSTTVTRDGLGPIFNANSCESCHIHDGKGSLPSSGEAGLLVRVSVGNDPLKGPIAHPVYGGQIQDKAVIGVPAEALVVVSYTDVKGKFKDGTAYTLRKPKIEFKKPGYGPIPEDILRSARLAPHMVGLGLLENIPRATISKLEDPADKDQDGISGRANQVKDHVTGKKVMGRFGWKAEMPTVIQQSVGAFKGDLGITSPVFRKDTCTASQKKCLSSPNGGSPELTRKQMDRLEVYTKLIAVPARRNLENKEVRDGAKHFLDLGCHKCHVPKMKTGVDQRFPELSNQTIFPFTDLLLHDMGEGLSDGRDAYLANGNEWKTPPLWGIGLVKKINPNAGFLHDGRARTLEEAVLWHGGEAESSREKYKSLSLRERRSLISFLNSL